MQDEKKKAMLEYPIPKNAKDVKSFLVCVVVKDELSAISVKLPYL